MRYLGFKSGLKIICPCNTYSLLCWMVSTEKSLNCSNIDARWASSPWQSEQKGSVAEILPEVHNQSHLAPDPQQSNSNPALYQLSFGELTAPSLKRCVYDVQVAPISIMSRLKDFIQRIGASDCLACLHDWNCASHNWTYFRKTHLIRLTWILC